MSRTTHISVVPECLWSLLLAWADCQPEVVSDPQRLCRVACHQHGTTLTGFLPRAWAPEPIRLASDMPSGPVPRRFVYRSVYTLVITGAAGLGDYRAR